MIHLSIDLETYSDVNLKKAGLYRYVQSPAFEILLFAYSFDGAPTQVIDMAQGEEIPMEVIHALTDPQCLKRAYNAAFEWYCLSKYMGAQLPPSQWRDTMLHGLYAGYTAGLDATGRALGIPEDKQKLTTGKALIRYFCVPCKPTKANGGRTRNYPHHDPEKWALFKTYNGQDVVAEMEIERRLSAFPVPDFVQKQWETDLLINARGVAVDMDFCTGALELGETIRAQLTDEAVQLSGLQNPNSVKQLTHWLSVETGDDITTLRKETIKEMLGRDNADHVQRMLEIRQELGKTSTTDASVGCYSFTVPTVPADGPVVLYRCRICPVPTRSRWSWPVSWSKVASSMHCGQSTALRMTRCRSLSAPRLWLPRATS